MTGPRHNMSYSREYSAWKSMMQRCFNKRARRYPEWGGRGITVCLRWRRFENFYADMGPRPEGKSLDRWPANDGNYEPGNCRWATAGQQVRNRTSTICVTMEGVTMCLKDWCRSLELNYQTVFMRINRGGLTPLEALILPLHKGQRI